jgi:CRP/FNR family transcriptional regulator, cyclic AMP receptor protein
MPPAAGDSLAMAAARRAPRARLCTWYIRHVDLFHGLSSREVDNLAHAASVRRFSAGQLIVGPETEPEWIYFPREGTVRLFQRDDSGQELVVERLAAGHLFGVTALFGPSPAEVLASAETDVELCAVQGSHFLGVVSHWPSALLELAQRLGFRLPEADEKLGRLTSTGTRARLARALHRLAIEGEATETQSGGGLRLRAVPRHADLAEEIGASRETVTRMLARLEADGYIRRFRRQIVVPDLDRLAEDFDVDVAT